MCYPNISLVTFIIIIIIMVGLLYYVNHNLFIYAGVAYVKNVWIRLYHV
jgi:hypothetical protein